MNGNLRGIFAVAVLAAGCGSGGGDSGGGGGAGGGGEQIDQGVGGGTGGQVVGGNGGEPVGGTGGTPVGGNGGEPVGGNGGEPVGGNGGNGGEPVGGNGGNGGEPVGGNGGNGGEPVGGGGGNGGEPVGGGGGGGEIVPPAECGAVSLNDGDQGDGTFLVTGSTAATENTATGSCGGDESTDAVYGFVAPADGTYAFTTRVADPEVQVSYDTVLYARLDCADPESEPDGALCNDDSGSTQSQIVVSLTRGQGLYLFVDGYGGESGDFWLRAYTLTELAVGDACVPGDEQAVCAAGLTCDEATGTCIDPNILPPEMCGDAINLNDGALDDGSFALEGTTEGAENAHTGTCGGDAAPDALFVFTAPADGTWTLTTQQPSADATYDTVLYARTECDDPNSEPSETACADDVGGGVLQSSITVDLVAGDSISVFVDGYGESAGAFVLSAFQQVTLAEGDACTAGDPRAICAEGTVCLDADGDGNTACATPVAPTIDSAEVFYNSLTEFLAVRVSGTDEDLDTAGLAFTLFDAAGEEIPLSFFGGPVYVEFNDVERNGADVSGTFFAAVAVPEAATASVFLFDGAGLESAALEVEVLPTPSAAAGEVCDFQGAFSACADGLVCDGAGAAPVDGLCAEPVADCEDGLDAIALLPGDDGLSQADGTLVGAVDGAAGSCSAAGAGERAIQLTAAVAGTYVVEISSADNDANFNIFMRTLCSVEDASAETACGGVTPDLLPLRLPVDLEAGASASYFVESAGGDAPWAGDFSVRTYLAHAPVIDSAVMYYNPVNSGLGFDVVGSDADGDLVGFTILMLDADGMPVISQEDGSPIFLQPEPSEITTDANGVSTMHVSRLVDGLTPDLLGTFEVMVFDGAFLTSDVIVPEIMAPADLAVGDACILDDAFANCPESCDAPNAAEGDFNGTCL
jgi:hypothetical protein